VQQRLREEITRTQAGVRLDLNLEKGRMRQESSEQELKIKEVDTRIEQEIAGFEDSNTGFQSRSASFAACTVVLSEIANRLRRCNILSDSV